WSLGRGLHKEWPQPFEPRPLDGRCSRVPARRALPRYQRRAVAFDAEDLSTTDGETFSPRSRNSRQNTGSRIRKRSDHLGWSGPPAFSAIARARLWSGSAWSYLPCSLYSSARLLTAVPKSRWFGPTRCSVNARALVEGGKIFGRLRNGQ